MLPILSTALASRLLRLPRPRNTPKTGTRERFHLTRGPRPDTTLFAPHPRDLAASWLRPAVAEAGLRTARESGVLYLMPSRAGREAATLLNVEALAADLARLVLALPDDVEADHLADLRDIVAWGEPERVRRYLARVAVLVGTGARPLPAPRRDPATRPAPMSSTQRSTASRERKRERERQDDTARVYLQNIDWSEWGGVVSSATLWASAQAVIEEWLDDRADDADGYELDAEDGLCPAHPVMPGRNAFLAIAAEVLDERLRRGVRVFVPRS